MQKLKKLALGIAAVGVLLAGVGTGVVVARSGLDYVYGEALRIAGQNGRSGTPDVTLAAGGAYLSGALEVDGAARFDGAVTTNSSLTSSGQNYTIVPATETITAAATITADACGGLKRISAASDVTTGTTHTITAPSASNSGCRMLIVNVSATQTIYLDSNLEFPVSTAASLALGPNGSVSVWSDGTFWRHGSWTEY